MMIKIWAGAGSVAAIEVGEQLHSPPSSETVWVSGGALTFDMHDQTRLPWAVIDDPELAMFWLPAVYGEAVSDALLGLLELSHADPSGEFSAEIAADGVEPGGLLAPARRVATGQWLMRWWPSARPQILLLDEGLLSLELASLKWQTPQLFDPAEASSEMSGLVPELAGRLGGLLSREGQQPGAGESLREEALWAAAACASHSLDLDTDEFSIVAEAHELRTTTSPGELTAGIDALVQELDAFRAAWQDRREQRPAHLAQGHYALAADELSGEEADHLVTVDPVQVPPRSVGGRDENVLVFVDAPGNLLEVRVTVGDSPVDRLTARVWPKDGFPLPRLIDLFLTPVGYYGQTSLDDLDPASCDVFDPEVVSPVRSATEIRQDLAFIRRFIISRRTDRSEPFAVEEQP